MIEIPRPILALLESGTPVLVPTAQRLVALKLAYAGAKLRDGHAAWQSPPILTWRGWLENRALHSGGGNATLLPELEEWLVFADAARQAWRESPGRVDPPSDALIESLRRSAHTLFEWRIPERALGGTPEADWLSQTIQLCDAVCAGRGAIARYRLPQITLRAGKVPTAVLLGFGLYTPVQRVLLESAILQELQLAEEPPLGAEPQVTGEGRLPRVDGSSTAVRGVVADSADEEIAVAADWARGRIEADPTARLLILIPQLRKRRHEAMRRFEQTLMPRRTVQTNRAQIPIVAVEGGRELNRFEVAAARIAMLRPPAGQLPVPEMLQWLRTVTHDLQRPGDAARLDVWLRSVLEADVSLAVLATALAKAPGPLRPFAAEVGSRLQLIAAVRWTARGTMRAWAREFRGIWTTVKRASGAAASGSAGRQTEERLDALLEELSQSLADSRHLDGHAAAAQLAAAAARTHFEPASGDVSVTLSSALGDPIVRYDGIWVTGLDADSWPPPARLDPFIPAVAQRAAGMTQTSAALLAREAEARMDSWARATPELVLSWPRMQEGIEQRASPLVSRLFKSERFEAPRPQLSLAERQCRPGRLERFDDARGAPWDFERIPSGSRALKLQASCAFRAYGELRLQAFRIEDRAPGIDPRDRGRLLHKALEALWMDLGSGRGLHAALGALDLRIDRAIHRAEAEIGWLDVRHAAYRHRQRELRRLALLLRALCEKDAARPEFLEVLCEQETSLALGGAELRLRIDRMDRLPNGHVAIFDYKSGRPHKLELTGERLLEPQLPLYALACGAPVDAVAMVHLTGAAIKLRGLAAQKGVLGHLDVASDWPAQVARWRGQLESLAAAFLAGDALRDPAEDACRSCHLQVLCRTSNVLEDLDEPSDE